MLCCSCLPTLFGNLVIVVGLAVFFHYFILNPLSAFYRYFIRSGKNLKKRYGAWTVVTGSTDGIGKAMAFELARKGLNVYLISRTQSKLDETQAAIKSKYPSVEVKTLAVDFSQFTESTRTMVAAAFKGLDIGVLVNNVGVSYPFTKYFHELTDDQVQALVSLNIDSTTWMTRIVIPGMVERKRGAVVNIGSAAGVTTSPLLAQYAAAKSYVAMFSKSLAAEYRSFGIDVQCQVPLFVATKLAKIRKTSLFVPSPSGYAKAAIAAIGREELISPYWSHALQMYIMDLLPEDIVTYITRSMHLDIRKKGMKKETKDKSQ